MLVDKKLLRNVDWVLVATILLLIGFGMIVIYSATNRTIGPLIGSPFYHVRRQLVTAMVGIAGAVVVASVDYRVFGRYYRAIYFATLGMLVLVLIVGNTVKGTTGWLRFGSLGGIQPAELAKLAIIITLARYLELKENIESWRDLVGPFVLVGVTMGLILLQPDFGTALVFVGILFGMLWVAGAPARYLVTIALSGLTVFTVAAILTKQGYLTILKPHQLDRLLVFLDPYAYRTGAGWNVIQSMIAIGSGGFFGKGMFAGSQTQLNFLPEHHTDFIFSVVGEEYGFIGTLCLLGLFALLLQRGLKVVQSSKDRFGALLATGIVSMFLFHILINVGMTLGIMPVTGIPLPFISFGGSSLLTNLLACGLLVGVHMRRQKILF